LLTRAALECFTLPSGNSINNNAKLHPSVLSPADVVSSIKIVLYPCRTLHHGLCAPPAAVMSICSTRGPLEIWNAVLFSTVYKNSLIMCGISSPNTCQLRLVFSPSADGNTSLSANSTIYAVRHIELNAEG
jgi:hypothetical protein